MSAFQYIRATKLARSYTVPELLMAAGIAALAEAPFQDNMHLRLDVALEEVQERAENHGHSKTFDDPVTVDKV